MKALSIVVGRLTLWVDGARAPAAEVVAHNSNGSHYLVARFSLKTDNTPPDVTYCGARPFEFAEWNRMLLMAYAVLPEWQRAVVEE